MWFIQAQQSSLSSPVEAHKQSSIIMSTFWGAKYYKPVYYHRHSVATTKQLDYCSYPEHTNTGSPTVCCNKSFSPAHVMMYDVCADQSAVVTSHICRTINNRRNQWHQEVQFDSLSLCVLLNVRFVVSTHLYTWASITIIIHLLCQWGLCVPRDREWALWSCNPWCSLIFCLHQPSAQPAWGDRPSSLSQLPIF